MNHKDIESDSKRLLTRSLALSLVATALVIAWYASRVFPWGLDIPHRDDFQDILEFIIAVNNASDWAQVKSALFDQHADHLTTASRLGYYLVFLVQGHVNFPTLAYVSHIGLIMLMALYWLQSEGSEKHKSMVLVALALLLFQPRAYTLMNWPMASFGFFFEYGYTLATLHFVSRGKHISFLFAIAAGVLATFTMSIGQLVWPLGLIALFLRRSETDLPVKTYIIVWLCAAALVLSFFYSIFAPALPMRVMIEYAINKPLVALQMLLATSGSAVGMGNLLASQILGAIAWVASAMFIINGLRNKLGTLHLFLLFNLAVFGIITLGRVFAIEMWVMVNLDTVALLPRYSFASLNLWVTLTLLCWNHYASASLDSTPNQLAGERNGQSARLPLLLLAICLGFNILSWRVFEPQLIAHHDRRVSDFNRYGLEPGRGVPFEASARAAAKEGIYVPPERPYVHDYPAP